MDVSQPSDKIITGLSPIKSLEQLLSSYLVAECIIEIRGEREQEIQKLAWESCPKLEVKDKILEDLYERFCHIINFKPTFVLLAKIGLEDIVRYDFISSNSVMTAAAQDCAHLLNTFGPTFTQLAKINLYEHTLRVFKNGIDVGEKQGRIMQTAIPMLACLFHDFGKSQKIRQQLLGEEVGKSYKAHADVSQMYVRERLSSQFIRLSHEPASETIDMLATVVQKHHISNNKDKNDTMVKFVTNADISARKTEMKILSKQED